MRFHNDVPVYGDAPGRRVLDLRPHGVDCIPVLGLSNFQSVCTGPGRHVHEGCVEISLCLRGNLVFDAAGVDYPFLPGSVFVSGPHEPHCLKNNPKGLVVRRILFAVPPGRRTILDLPMAESRWLVRRLTHFPTRLFRATDRVKGAFEKMFLAYDSDGRPGSPERRLKMKSAALELLLALVEAASSGPAAQRGVGRKVQELIDAVRASPEEDWNVAEMARRAALSAVALTDAFKRATGLPPHAYVLHCRISRAQAMLAETDATVEAVATRLRFSSLRHFAAAFRRAQGCTPTQWRRANGSLK